MSKILALVITSNFITKIIFTPTEMNLFISYQENNIWRQNHKILYIWQCKDNT